MLFCSAVESPFRCLVAGYLVFSPVFFLYSRLCLRVQRWNLCTGGGSPGCLHCQLYIKRCFCDAAVVFNVEISVQVLAHLVVLTASWILFIVVVMALLLGFSVEISVQVLAHLVVLTASCILFFVLLSRLLCSALRSLYRCWPTWSSSLPAASHYLF